LKANAQKREEAFIGDVGECKVFRDIESARKVKQIQTYVGTAVWMSPEMSKALQQNSNLELVKSDIFSLGLIGFFCLDPIEFMNSKSAEFNINEKLLEDYLMDFYSRLLAKDKFYLPIFYILRCMVSFSYIARPDIHLLYEFFSHIENDYLRQVKFY
jgi:serine/threonine protein kinase